MKINVLVMVKDIFLFPQRIIQNFTTDERKSADAFQEAIQSGSSERVQQFLSANPDLINLPLPNGSLPLSFAIRKKRTAVVDHLLTLKPNIWQKDDQNLTSLDHAILSGDKELAKTLLQSVMKSWIPQDLVSVPISLGFDPNEEDANGMTPLLLAIKNHDSEAINRLLANGADPFKKNRHQVCALDLLSEVCMQRDPLKISPAEGLMFLATASYWVIQACVDDTSSGYLTYLPSALAGLSALAFYASQASFDNCAANIVASISLTALEQISGLGLPVQMVRLGMLTNSVYTGVKAAVLNYRYDKTKSICKAVVPIVNASQPLYNIVVKCRNLTHSYFTKPDIKENLPRTIGQQPGNRFSMPSNGNIPDDPPKRSQKSKPSDNTRTSEDDKQHAKPGRESPRTGSSQGTKPSENTRTSEDDNQNAKSRKESPGSGSSQKGKTQENFKASENRKENTKEGIRTSASSQGTKSAENSKGSDHIQVDWAKLEAKALHDKDRFLLLAKSAEMRECFDSTVMKCFYEKLDKFSDEKQKALKKAFTKIDKASLEDLLFLYNLAAKHNKLALNHAIETDQKTEEVWKRLTRSARVGSHPDKNDGDHGLSYKVDTVIDKIENYKGFEFSQNPNKNWNEYYKQAQQKETESPNFDAAFDFLIFTYLEYKIFRSLDFWRITSAGITALTTIHFQAVVSQLWRAANLPNIWEIILPKREGEPSSFYLPAYLFNSFLFYRTGKIGFLNSLLLSWFMASWEIKIMENLWQLFGGHKNKA